MSNVDLNQELTFIPVSDLELFEDHDKELGYDACIYLSDGIVVSNDMAEQYRDFVEDFVQKFGLNQKTAQTAGTLRVEVDQVPEETREFPIASPAEAALKAACIYIDYLKANEHSPSQLFDWDGTGYYEIQGLIFTYKGFDPKYF